MITLTVEEVENIVDLLLEIKTHNAGLLILRNKQIADLKEKLDNENQQQFESEITYIDPHILKDMEALKEFEVEDD